MSQRAQHARHEIRLDRLLGRQVLAANNRPIGRLEECRVTTAGAKCTVSEYVIGMTGLAERLGIGINLLLGKATKGYVARWDQIDISDPERPRLTCSVSELRAL